jgi:adenosine deaminase
LEGSLRLDTLVQVAQAHGMEIANQGKLPSLVQVNEKEPYTFQNFLSKFETLRLFYRSPEIIDRVTREAVADAAADHVVYMELRFTPVALSRAQGFPLADVMDWVSNGVHHAQQEFGVKTRLIASVNRHEPVAIAEQVANLAIERIGRGIIGLDLAGNEAQFSAQPFKNVIQSALHAGLYVTMHAGEWGGAANVIQAIQEIRANRIGHGVRVVEDPVAVELAAQSQIPFEVCVTSNYQSGVVPAINDHPLPRMLQAGLKVTVNTDDPSISRITLSDEYRLVCEELGLSFEALKECILNAARSAFLPQDERSALVGSLEGELSRAAKVGN